MNIAFFSLEDFNPHTGGTERISCVLAEEFIKNGHSVFFISPKAFTYKLPSIEYFKLNEKVDTKQNVRSFAYFIEKNHIDIVVNQHAYSEAAISLIEKVRLKSLAKFVNALHSTPDLFLKDLPDTVYSPFPSCRTPLRLWRRYQRVKFRSVKLKNRAKKSRYLFRKAYEGSDCILLLSDMFKPVFQSLAGIADTSKLFAINNANTYSSSEIEISMPKENVLLFVGRMAVEKRIDIILHIWSRLQDLYPSWRLEIVGGGGLFDDVKYLVKKMKLQRVSMHGRQTPNAYYAKSKIILATSKFEGWGLNLTEAMQHGCVPVAFSSYAALNDIVEGGKSGIAIEDNNVEEFVRRLSELMADESRLLLLSENAKESVKRFDMSKIIIQWENLFNELVK